MANPITTNTNTNNFERNTEIKKVALNSGAYSSMRVHPKFKLDWIDTVAGLSASQATTYQQPTGHKEGS